MNKNQLYETIMRQVSKEVNKALNEVLQAHPCDDFDDDNKCRDISPCKDNISIFLKRDLLNDLDTLYQEVDKGYISYKQILKYLDAIKKGVEYLV